MPVVFDDRITNRDAFIANIGTGIIARGRYELANDVLALVTERTAEGIVRSGALQTGSPTERKIKRPLAPIGRLFAYSISTLERNSVRSIKNSVVETGG
jgi:hypothetical protein